MKKRSKERLEKWSEKMVVLLGIALWWIILSVVVCIVSILENGGFNKSAKEDAILGIKCATLTVAIGASIGFLLEALWLLLEGLG